MSEDTLREYIQQYINGQPVDQVTFAWQGGEPTLLGVDYFRRVVELQKEYANGKTIENSLQTNGTRLNDEWGEFLAENDFLVGISVDGPEKLHNRFRLSRQGEGTHADVMRGLEFLKKHDVRWNTLTTVNRENSLRPDEVYRFLKGIGSRHIQFIPILERKPTGSDRALGLKLASPGSDEENSPVTPWSVRPRDWGNFLSAVFKRWWEKDVGKIYIQLIEDVFAKIVQAPQGGLCSHSMVCGSGLAMEHNGDVYSCDHYVYPRHRLGNIHENSLEAMVDSPRQVDFGNAKHTTLTQQCRDCTWLAACGGDCPKHRFHHSRDGERQHSWLCEGYATFFEASVPKLVQLARGSN